MARTGHPGRRNLGGSVEHSYRLWRQPEGSMNESQRFNAEHIEIRRASGVRLRVCAVSALKVVSFSGYEEGTS